jgi:putative RecB family exonuclease
LQVLANPLHISHSQITTYLACSLKYRFRYVERRVPERRGIALPFGIAVHSAVEHHYRELKEGAPPAAPERLKELFSDTLSRITAAADPPIAFNKTLPDIDQAHATGRRMLEVFAAEAAHYPESVVDVEVPLSAPLIDAYGRDTGFQLIGIVDLLVEDEVGRLTVVDLKTASRAKDPADVDADLQLSGYAELLAANRYILPAAPLSCRLDVLIKSKTPRLVRYPSTRTAEDRLRFLQIACGVLHGIDAGLFLPNRGWLCADCEYGDACAGWHLT